jgi:hypothetical protein
VYFCTRLRGSPIFCVQVSRFEIKHKTERQEERLQTWDKSSKEALNVDLAWTITEVLVLAVFSNLAEFLHSIYSLCSLVKFNVNYVWYYIRLYATFFLKFVELTIVLGLTVKL